jgi:hypothetical protein
LSKWRTLRIMPRNLNEIVCSWIRLLNCMLTCVCVGTLSMLPQEATPLTSGIYWYYVGTVDTGSRPVSSQGSKSLSRRFCTCNCEKSRFFPTFFLLVLVSDLQATIYSICSDHNPVTCNPCFFPSFWLVSPMLRTSRSDPHVTRPFLDFLFFASPFQTSCFFKRGLKLWTQEWPTWIPPLWLAALYIRGAAITMSPTLLTPLSSRVCNLELAQTSYPS